MKTQGHVTLPDAGQDVLKDAAAGVVKKDVVGDDGLHSELGRKPRQLMQAHLIAGASA